MIHVPFRKKILFTLGMGTALEKCLNLIDLLSTLDRQGFQMLLVPLGWPSETG